MALKRTTTLDESFFLYVSRAASACAGYGVPALIDTEGGRIKGDAGVRALASTDDDAISLWSSRGAEHGSKASHRVETGFLLHVYRRGMQNEPMVLSCLAAITWRPLTPARADNGIPRERAKAVYGSTSVGKGSARDAKGAQSAH